MSNKRDPQWLDAMARAHSDFERDQIGMVPESDWGWRGPYRDKRLAAMRAAFTKFPGGLAAASARIEQLIASGDGASSYASTTNADETPRMTNNPTPNPQTSALDVFNANREDAKR